MKTVLPITGRKMGELCRLLEERGVGNNMVQLGLIQRVNEVVSWMCDAIQIYPVFVDYRRTLEQMVKAGDYDDVNINITSANFPVKGKGRTWLNGQLVHLGKEISFEEALPELASMNLRSATLPELLALGESYPGIQLQFPVVALGSVGRVWNYSPSRRDVPYLNATGIRRGLSLVNSKSICPHEFRFFAFPE